jgi:hypothetical protein
LKAKLYNFNAYNQRLIFGLILVIYYYVIREGYQNLFTIYGYVGFEYEINPRRTFYSISIFYTFLLLLLRSKHLSSFHWTVSGFIYTMTTIPMIIYYEYNPNTPSSYLLGHLILFLGYIFLAGRTYNIHIIKTHIKKKNNVLIFTSILVLFMLPFLFTYGFEFNFKVFSLGDEIYDVRLNAREKNNIATAYLEGWLSNVICPIIVIYGILHKKKILILLSSVSLLYIFLTSAQKAVFISFFVVLLFTLIKGYEKKLIIFTLLVTIFSALGLKLYSDDVPNIFITLILYRYLFVPIQVGCFYYEYFADNYTYWGQSPFNPFVNYPYSVTPPYLIGIEYFNSPTMAANTGIVADGYMNMGMLGTILNVILFVFLISLWYKLKPDESYFGIIFIFLEVMQNAALNTILLTHGLLLLLLFFAMFKLNRE